MQKYLKILIFTFCFGLLCLLLLNKTTNIPYRFVRRKIEVIRIQETIEQNEVPAELDTRFDDIFETRRNKIEYFCDNLQNGFNSSLETAISNMVIDTQHSLTWCPIYKSASSLWMKNFAILSGLSPSQNLHFGHKNQEFRSIVKQKFQHRNDVKEALNEIQRTVKFMVVRHPFERLLSAYRDKLEHMQGREYYYKRYGQYITQRYRTKHSNLTNLEPSFTEFLQFIANEKRFDEHWIPFVDSCQPCSINYDYIFKFESLCNEYNFFITKYNLDNYLDYLKGDHENASSQGITNDIVAKKYFDQVPAQLLLNIFQIYKLDFLLFSYSPAKYYYLTNDIN